MNPHDRRTAVEALRAYIPTLPEGTVVPVSREVLMQALETVPVAVPSPLPPVDLTVEILAARFDRKPSTIREWCEGGVFSGAYKFRDREWRVPMESVLAFEAQQRAQRRRPG